MARDILRSGAVALALLFVSAGAPARAGSVLDRVRQNGVVRCGAEERPGFAAVAEDGRITGLAVDLCRAAAIAVLGPDGKINFSIYDSARDFDAVRDGTDDLSFLSGTAIAEQALAARVIPGPPVFIDQFSILVPETAPARTVADLAGKTVCLMIGSAAQRALEAALDHLRVTAIRLPFEEDVEMLDAYNVGRCDAMTDQATRLADMRQTAGINHLRSRILDDALALDPILAATGTADGNWAALVFWLLHALILDDAPASPWRAPGAEALPIQERALGLRPGWPRDVRAALGGYREMYRRDLGDASALKLPAGPNALWPAGLLLAPTSP